MNNAKLRSGLLCLLGVMVGCKAPVRDWNGTWKLNLTKSSYQSTAVTISTSADGEYRNDDGVVSTFRCDGKYRSIGQHREENCVKSSAITLDRTVTENGVKTKTFHWEMSAGGRILTSTAIKFGPDGPVVMGQLVLSRMSGSNDFAGQWQNATPLQRDAELTLRVDGEFLHIGYPRAGQFVDVPLSGAEATVYGSNASAGVTFAVQKVGERRYLIVGKVNGKPYKRETLELSNDGRIVTVSWSNADKPIPNATLIYEKEEANRS